jgi:hypothetical protein
MALDSRAKLNFLETSEERQGYELDFRWIKFVCRKCWTQVLSGKAFFIFLNIFFPRQVMAK